MSCSYVIESQLRLVLTTLLGVVTAAEAFAHQESLASDPEFRPEFNQLIDSTGAEKLDLSSVELRKLATRNFFSQGSRRALLVRGTLLYGVGRMLVTFRELAGAKEEMQIFQDRNEALAWLGLPAE
jgi:hypothetical protein